MTPAASPRRLWWLLVAFTGSVLAYFTCYPAHFAVIGVNHYGLWFLDAYAILASNDALAHGINVYGFNPLDYFGRPHVYPHWWLLLGRLGLTRTDYAWFGFAIGAAFFVAAVARLRPRQPAELVWNLLIFCSPPVLLALDRANNDLVIFALLAPVVPCLLARRAAWRYGSIALLTVATALKIYPAVAGCVLLAGSNSREVRRRVIVFVAVVALLSFDLVRDYSRYGGIVPHPDGLMTFGAANIFLAMGAKGVLANLLALGTGGAIAAGLWRWDLLEGWAPDSADEGSWLSLVLGAALLTGCFFAGQSFGYRWVFALWLLPLLWRLWRDERTPVRARRLAAFTGALLTLALWIDPLTSAVLTPYAKMLGDVRVTRWANNVFLAEQPLTWALFGCLLAFLIRFARDGLRTLWGAGVNGSGPTPRAESHG